ncbi:hypothetical protein K503DRAFT_537169 [Rhizopogon vinicolor AM-OR11-026]|uniref:VPS37 C-terminal domain-containing protein n=1 Tax=Rhizopogon vinicolor AM-OR11-026 TaxID=1314800 RepID=A0A1B7MKW5_9AGAM|nr:hypothetical protein K503DRAFT_537169 [Rhizopogon vinicolor AM-OR11-026]
MAQVTCTYSITQDLNSLCPQVVPSKLPTVNHASCRNRYQHLDNDSFSSYHPSHFRRRYSLQGGVTKFVFHRREDDLEDILSDPTYFESIFHSLPHVKDLYQAQTELGMANEATARKSYSSVDMQHVGHFTLGTDLSLQDRLYLLRTGAEETSDKLNLWSLAGKMSSVNSGRSINCRSKHIYKMLSSKRGTSWCNNFGDQLQCSLEVSGRDASHW